MVILEPRVFEDRRGWFFESFRSDVFRREVCDTAFVQENESRSVCGVVRGLHYQLPPSAQSKLVRVVRGKVVDVAVDIRRGSPSFGRWVAVELSEENRRQLFIPRGFAHGFAAVGGEAVLQYKCDNYYDPAAERGITWNDPDIGIKWPAGEVIVSDKDAQYPSLKEMDGADLFDFGAKLY